MTEDVSAIVVDVADKEGEYPGGRELLLLGVIWHDAALGRPGEQQYEEIACEVVNEDLLALQSAISQDG